MAYLICDPSSGLVVRRSRDGALSLKEQHLVSFAVSSATWKSYRAGDSLCAADLNSRDLDRWIKTRMISRRS